MGQAFLVKIGLPGAVWPKFLALGQNWSKSANSNGMRLASSSLGNPKSAAQFLIVSDDFHLMRASLSSVSPIEPRDRTKKGQTKKA